MLSKKKCKILFVEFPIYEKLDSALSTTPLNLDLRKNKQTLINELNLTQRKVILSGKRLMHDLTHLNSNGAIQSTKAIASQINNGYETLYLTLKK